MSDNDVYLAIVDEIFEELNQYKFSSREELREKIVDIQCEYCSRLEQVIDNIEEDYAEEKDLKWRDEDE